MGVHIVRGAHARRLFPDFLFQPREPGLPMPAVGLALAALLVADAGQHELVGIELGRRLGDAPALLLQQLGQLPRLFLAALGELLPSPRASRSSAMRSKRRQQIGDILFDQRLDAGRGHGGRRARLAQRVLELIERSSLRRSRRAAAAACGPARLPSRSR